jgi:YqaJ-like viral recombinase domain
VKIIDCQQNTTAWMLARCGVVTASEVDALVTPLWKARAGAGVQTYLYQKLSERVMGYIEEGPASSFAMTQGQIVETIAVPWYEFAHDVKINRVGFCVSDDGKIGCSPDGLIGDEGGIEIKSPQPKQHLRYLLEGVVPADYVAQVQFSLYVTGRKWWKFVSYNTHLPALVVHVEPDQAAHAVFAKVTKEFIAQLDADEAKVRAMMQPGERAP